MAEKKALSVGLWSLAVTALAATTLTEKFEGYVPNIYLDSTGTPTFCFGDTDKQAADPTWIYSKEQCAILLRERMKRDYAPQLAKCLPQLVDRDRINISAALLDASYNAGYNAVCRSRMAASVRAGKWADACNGLVGWYETSKGKWFRGLHRRRVAERDLCIKDLT